MSKNMLYLYGKDFLDRELAAVERTARNASANISKFGRL
jgi:hypothetical protein